MPHAGRKEVLEKGDTPAMVIGWLAEGKRLVDILPLVAEATGHNVSRSAVANFRKRHQAEIVALQQTKVEGTIEVIADLAIKDKAERIRRLSGLYDKLAEVVETRGVETTDIVWVGGARDGRFVTRKRVDTATIQQMRGILEDVNYELTDSPGETHPAQTNILALLVDNDEGRELLARLLRVLPLGGSHAGGLGSVRQ